MTEDAPATGPVADAAARAAAIDPERSFIVQAPAGSGKTGLLTQRYLRLLATVDAPEEIVAITFTRKAAGEMRERIIGALAGAGDDTPPAGEHDAETQRLARAARRRDAELGWGLERHPARLRIQTIDAFNAALTRQMPLLSGLGAPPAIADEPEALHEAAARRTIDALESGERWSDAVAALLLHLDNRLDQAEQMLAAMLARRDQWLRPLLDARAGDRRALEAAIAAEIRLHLQRARDALPAELGEEIVELAAGAAERLTADGRDSEIAACAGLNAVPDADPAQLPQWRGLAALLLTATGQRRKGVDARIGFPPRAADDKLRMRALLGRLEDAAPGCEAALHALRALPPPHYEERQWRLLEALTTMLPLAAAELQIVFAERGEVDHAEIALRALQALGGDESPTELALVLDYRIRHILVDEFQDTSTGQYRLLEALTRGWTPGDGRSLFLVGDPMQSIYRFREAEVGLFLRARQEGIGAVTLEPLRLEVNFRSRAPVVEWVNECFPDMLAPAEDPGAGAVPFERSRPVDDGADGGVSVHPMLGPAADAAAEAAAVAELARRRLAETDDGRVAILVRGRPQAAEILPALRAAGLRFQAVDIESLASRGVVQDLLALTRALDHDADRASWLALLRAPWCGASLADLHAIAGDGSETTIAERLADPDTRARLSDAARSGVERLLAALASADRARRRTSLRDRVETTWHALGGPAAAGSAAALDDADAFLALLERVERAGTLEDVNMLDDALARLYARPDPDAGERLQVMTIHRAKGLEFDTVILPGLHAGVRRDDPPLLQWMERPRLGRDPDLLLAPVRPADRPDGDRLYAFVNRLATEKDAHEQGRLLYVAVTRAIRRLDLFGFARTARDDDGGLALAGPSAGSLLSRLWPAVEPAFRDALAAGGADAHDADGASAATPRFPARLRRLPADWQPPDPRPPVQWRGGVADADVDVEDTEVEYEWAGESARIAGIVVHRMLQQVADDGPAAWDGDRLRRAEPAIAALLAGLGAEGAVLDEARARTMQALENVLDDPTGRWILGPHPEAAAELALSAFDADALQTHVIDRYFVDAHGTAWVVDYKTGYREGGDVDGFLAQELERYAPQLERYAELAAEHTGRPVRAALYYPLMRAFRELPR